MIVNVSDLFRLCELIVSNCSSIPSRTVFLLELRGKTLGLRSAFQMITMRERYQLDTFLKINCVHVQKLFKLYIIHNYPMKFNYNTIF